MTEMSVNVHARACPEVFDENGANSGSTRPTSKNVWNNYAAQKKKKKL